MQYKLSVFFSELNVRFFFAFDEKLRFSIKQFVSINIDSSIANRTSQNKRRRNGNRKRKWLNNSIRMDACVTIPN